MRNTLLAAGLSLFVSAAALAASDESAPQARAYFSYSFGGTKAQTNDLRYGLQLDHGLRANDRHLAPLFQLELARGGSARLNGLELATPRYRLYQNGEGDGEENGGFFSGILDFFSNLFGGEDEEAAAGETDEEVAAVEGEGYFGMYEPVDLMLLGVTAVGLGYLATEVLDGNDREIPQPATGAPPPPSCSPGPSPLCLPRLPLPLQGMPAGLAEDVRLAAEYREWLDGGTGQMGDLH